jgi:hypothetical protein
MKKNTNSRKISLIKNNLWKKQLRRQCKILSGNKDVVDNSQDYLDEINLLFPHLNGDDKSMVVEISDKEKKIVTVTVGSSLYEGDILEELKKYKDVPMKGFRQISKKKVKNTVHNQMVQKKLGSMTLMDFRFGSQIRENLMYTKYFQEGKNQAVEQNSEFKDLTAAPFNLKKGNTCSFNIIFHDNQGNADASIQEFMMNNMKQSNPNTEEVEATKEVKENKETKKTKKKETETQE